VDDAVQTLRHLVAEPKGVSGTFNLGNQEQELSIGEVARIVLRTMGRADLNIVPLPETPGSPSRRCPDMSRTIEMTGFKPAIDLEEGAQRTYKWYSDNVFLKGKVSAI
jgi:UDP-glucose 4-epimerase